MAKALRNSFPVVEAPACTPEIQYESCASPRHEALETMRWARSLPWLSPLWQNIWTTWG